MQKRALVVAWYGSTNTEAGERVIAPLLDELDMAFSQIRVTEALASAHIRERLAAQEPDALSLPPLVNDAVDLLEARGMGPVAVLPLLIADGPQMAKLRESLAGTNATVGGPLIADKDDERHVAQALDYAYPARPSHILLLVGHGSRTASDAVYGRIAQALRDLGRTDVASCTMDELPAGLPDRCAVTVVPLMLVAGTHVAREIAGTNPSSLRARLNAAGHPTEVVRAGLGELPGVRALAVEHTRALLEA